MLDQQPPTSAASAPPVIILPPRQEAFCRAMACGVGAAEAARRAGYSPKGAKQRGAVLMGQPEIRVRVGQLSADRWAGHQADLDEAAALVKTIMYEAVERKSIGLSLRAVDLWTKLRGVVQDKRIPHHYLGDRPHPDADLENHDCPPEEEEAGHAAPAEPAAQPSAPTPPKPNGAAVPFRPVPAAKPSPRRNSDLSARSIVTSPATGAPFGSTALFGSTSLSAPSAPVPPFRVSAAAPR
ncbi:terminase small subunit [Skermanella mucosa]|uniref:terminase small subunit n=1 Tax=Skermanella mucosa TaxID=1789672 RepID=UPI00192AA32D|nr:terminase small subunit [Skermanella mucosa]UEM22670.1 terminase small subunit [Skermanella mucosa]